MYVKNYGDGQNWLPGVITKCTGPVSFHVKLKVGRERRCHQDQIRSRSTQEEPEEEPEMPEQISFDPMEALDSSSETPDPPEATTSATATAPAGTSTGPTANTGQPVVSSSWSEAEQTKTSALWASPPGSGHPG